MGQVPQPLHVTPGCWARIPVTPAAAFCHHWHGPRSAPDAGPSSANSASKRSADASASRARAWKGRSLATRARPSRASRKPAPPEDAIAISNAAASGPRPGVSAAAAAMSSRNWRHALLRPLLAAWLILSTSWAARWAKAGSPCKTREASIAGVNRPPSRRAQAASRSCFGRPWQTCWPPWQSPPQPSARPARSSGQGPHWPSQSGSAGRSPVCPTCPSLVDPESGPSGGISWSFRTRTRCTPDVRAACCSRKSSKVCGVSVHRSPSSSSYFTQLWRGADTDCGTRSGRRAATARDTESYVGSSCRVRR
mmetsp:Transcript_26230/g.79121  ORF Transcript_26230/g.79121 Transcript_26230/m.79121 type:complete len:309 (-) Transcript_26230:128-1054(-)